MPGGGNLKLATAIETQAYVGKGGCSRPKYWEELTTEEKVEQLAQVLDRGFRAVSVAIERFNDRLYGLESHRHGENGELVVSLGMARRPSSETLDRKADCRSLFNRAPEGFSTNLAQAKDIEGKRLPMYKSHKTVCAAKIESMTEVGDGGYEFQCSGIPGPAIKVVVDKAFMAKHEPQIGGYYVLYEDGYQSYSPAEAFESGYTRI